MRIAVAAVEEHADRIPVEDVDQAAVVVAGCVRGDDDREPPDTRPPEQS